MFYIFIHFLYIYSFRTASGVPHFGRVSFDKQAANLKLF